MDIRTMFAYKYINKQIETYEMVSGDNTKRINVIGNIIKCDYEIDNEAFVFMNSENIFINQTFVNKDIKLRVYGDEEYEGILNCDEVLNYWTSNKEYKGVTNTISYSTISEISPYYISDDNFRSFKERLDSSLRKENNNLKSSEPIILTMNNLLNDYDKPSITFIEKEKEFVVYVSFNKLDAIKQYPYYYYFVRNFINNITSDIMMCVDGIDKERLMKYNMAKMYFSVGCLYIDEQYFYTIQNFIDERVTDREYSLRQDVYEQRVNNGLSKIY